ncbi:PaaI family thioesterase [Gordonibacter pamelaeae]|uniref:PaaI family thioesterase n=1 Tax=Gordonibacter pamelaeae TaxID=471189 RepID=UPI00242B178C|nr:PaaI family thioesterase [Gordonibacter pamelaeae]
MLPDNPTRDQIEAVFANDRFATQAAGCRVVEGERGRAVCEMELADIHKNAMGNVMGGAIFTLADFALAVSCNIGEEPTVSVDSNISFLLDAGHEAHRHVRLRQTRPPSGLLHRDRQR